MGLYLGYICMNFELFSSYFILYNLFIFETMSIVVIAVASESGVPMFSRKRGSCDNVSVSDINYLILFS